MVSLDNESSYYTFPKICITLSHFDYCIISPLSSSIVRFIVVKYIMHFVETPNYHFKESIKSLAACKVAILRKATLECMQRPPKLRLCALELHGRAMEAVGFAKRFPTGSTISACGREASQDPSKGLRHFLSLRSYNWLLDELILYPLRQTLSDY